MQKQSIEPDQYTYSIIFSACDNEFASQGKDIYRQMRNRSFQPDTVLTNTIIKMLSETGELQEALEMFWEMTNSKNQPNDRTFSIVFSACAKENAVEEGIKVYEYITENKIKIATVTYNAILRMFSECGCFEKAMDVFQVMIHNEAVPNEHTFAILFKGCADYGTKKQSETLLNYTSQYYLHDDIILQTACMKMLVRHNDVESAVSLFWKMKNPDEHAYSLAIAACAEQPEFYTDGERMIDHMTRHKREFGTAVNISLVKFYAKNKMITRAVEVFTSTKELNEQFFVTLLNACIHSEEYEKAIPLIPRINSNLSASVSVQGTIIKLYGKANQVEKAKQVYFDAVKRGLVFDENAYSKTLAVAANAGNIVFGEMVRNHIDEANLLRTTTMRNSMIQLYAKCNNMEKAIQIYQELLDDKCKPDDYTYSILLTGCADTGLSVVGERIWNDMLQYGDSFSDQTVVSLLNMLARCGRAEECLQAFNEMQKRGFTPNVIAWNAVLLAFAVVGNGAKAITVFEELTQRCRPDARTFTALFTACSHSMMVDEALAYFQTMKSKYNIEPDIIHENCIVDVLGRANKLKDAQKFINKMRETNYETWMSLFAATRLYGDVARAEEIFEKLVQIRPRDSATHVMMANIYAEAKLYGDMSKIRNLMQEKKITKTTGVTEVEVHGRMYQFCAGILPDEFKEAIIRERGKLYSELASTEYTPITSVVTENVDEQQRQHILREHCEKSALTFAISQNENRTAVYMIKNLRTCKDCHSFIKAVSSIRNQTIIMRDSARFHKFENGKCSCGDCW